MAANMVETLLCHILQIPLVTINPAVHNLTDLHFVSDTQVLGSNYSGRSVPHGQSRIKQTVINDARVRYSGVMPSGHFMHAGCRSHVGGGEREAMENILQWSQWLKCGAQTGPASLSLLCIHRT